ncbi:MAG: BON domain-containing protein [Chloroflexi bacterium]|nr:BON domain-containing protein [Chloroflexota bacterium]
MARYDERAGRPARDWDRERREADWRDDYDRPPHDYGRYPEEERGGWGRGSREYGPAGPRYGSEASYGGQRGAEWPERARGYEREEHPGPPWARRWEDRTYDEGWRYGRDYTPEYGSYGRGRGYEPDIYRFGRERYGQEERPLPPRGPGMPAGAMASTWGYQVDWTRPGPFTGYGPRGYRRSDERIREEVCERLMLHGELDARDIEVRVDDGEVTLSGRVDSRFAKRLAEDIADTVVGVRNVHNQLRVEQRQEAGTEREGRRETGAAPQAAAVERGRLHPDMEIVGSDAELVGRVKEVRGNDVLVDRPGKRDLLMPLSAIRDIRGEQVLLSIPAGRVDQMGWEPAPLVANAPAR